MFNSVLTLKKAGRLTCAWLPTGDPRQPLACVWTVARQFRPASAAQSDVANLGQSPARNQAGRACLCA